MEIKTINDYYEDVDEYCDSDECDQREELERFREEVFGQVDLLKLY